MARGKSALRTNVEAGFIGGPRHKRLARELGVDEQRALGIAVCLWHYSQNEGMVGGTAEQIVDWAQAWDLEDRLIEALEKARMIAPEGGDGSGGSLYRIRGNEDQLRELTAYRERKAEAGRAGGMASWEARKARGLPRRSDGRFASDRESDDGGSPNEPKQTTEAAPNEQPNDRSKPKPDTDSDSDSDSEEKENGAPTGEPLLLAHPSPGKPRFDFEALYREFPQRDGGKGMRKAQGMAKLEAQITSQARYEAFARAVRAYAAYVRRKRSEDPKWCYNVQWGTFCTKSFWTDWVPPAEAPSRPPGFDPEAPTGYVERSWDEVMQDLGSGGGSHGNA